MSVSDSLFQLRSVDDRLWPTVRGAGIIGDVFDSECLSVSACHGHVAAVFVVSSSAASPRQYALFSFDAAAATAATSSSFSASSFLVDESAATFRAFLSGSRDSVLGVPGAPCVAVFPEPPLSVTFFSADNFRQQPLRLCYLDVRGALTVFLWDPRSEKWVSAGTAEAFVDTPCALQEFGFNAVSQTVFWVDDGVISEKRLVVPSLREVVSDRKTVSVSSADASVVQKSSAFKPGTHCLACRSGVWSIAPHEVQFFSFLERRVFLLPFHDRTKLSSAPELLLHLSAVHPASAELFVVDTEGSLFVFGTEDSASPTSKSADQGRNGDISVNDRSAITNNESVQRKSCLRMDRACILQGTNSSILNDSVSLCASRHSVLILADNPARLMCFDLLSGLLMSVVNVSDVSVNSARLPRFWGPAPDDPAGRFGIWGPSAFFAVQCSPPTVYARALVAVATCRDGKEHSQSIRDLAAASAVDICHDWRLDQWVARFAFDILSVDIISRSSDKDAKSNDVNSATAEVISSNDKEDEDSRKAKEEIARALAAHIQNPALLIGLLSGKNMNSLLESELERFLAGFYAQSSPNGVSESHAKQKSYELFTPLNARVVDNIARFLNVLKAERLGASRDHTPTSDLAPTPALFLRDVSVSSIVSLDWQTLSAFSSENPSVFANVLCEALGLTPKVLEDSLVNDEKDDPETDIYTLYPRLFEPVGDATDKSGSAVPGTGVRDKSRFGTAARPSLFDIVCATLYDVDPLRIINVVHAVARSNTAPSLGTLGLSAGARTSVSLRVVSSRALRALSPVSLAEQCHGNAKLAQDQACATAGLLDLAGRPLDAMLLLLRHRYWDTAVEFLARVCDKGPQTATEASQLFQAALREVLLAQEVRVLPALWQHLPPGLDPLHLVQIFQECFPEPAAAPIDPNAKVTVSMIKPALLKLLSEKK